jgi:hypothetical protein
MISVAKTVERPLNTATHSSVGPRLHLWPRLPPYLPYTTMTNCVGRQQS